MDPEVFLPELDQWVHFPWYRYIVLLLFGFLLYRLGIGVEIGPDFYLLYPLFIRLVLDPNHGALLLPGPEVKLLLFAIDVEADFSGSNIDLCSSGAEEWSPQDERRFLRCLHV